MYQKLKTMKTLVLTFLALMISVLVTAQQTITGKIIDAETNEPLPYATIGFEHYHIGTLSEADGFFKMTISEALRDHEVTVSFIGYGDYKFIPRAVQGELKIALQHEDFQFDEVVIRAVTADEYMKKVIRRISENYMNTPFNTISSYSELFQENERVVSIVDAEVLSYQYPYLLDSTNQHQLLAYTEKGAHEIEFMKDRAEKKKAKKKRKAEKKGEEFDEEDYNVVKAGFGGPETILKMDPVRNLTNFMDSTQFKKFRFEFMEPTVYNGRDVEVVQIKTKGKYDHQKFTVNVFVDQASLAIIKIEQTGKYVIPVAVKPVLLAFGITIDETKYEHSIKYKSTNGIWYPEVSQWDLHLGIGKLHFFSKNEYSLFEIGQVFRIKNIETEDIREIESSKRLDTGKELDKQIYPLEDEAWQQVVKSD